MQCALVVAQEPSKPPSGLTRGAIAGIAIGCFLLIVIIAAVLIVLCAPTPKARTVKPTLAKSNSWKSAIASSHLHMDSVENTTEMTGRSIEPASPRQNASHENWESAESEA